ncbi:MAG: glycosyltransferase [Rhizobiales bacterium]|nr:glycosyltransferase [Hyphomicrobiales bacterium]
MTAAGLSILNIGLDRDLLASDRRTEAQDRQLIYANGLPAHLVHLVKAPADAPCAPISVDRGVHVIPCPVSHWAQFPISAVRAGARELRRRRFDLLQVQEPYLSGLAGAMLARRFGLPLVVGVYSDEVDNPVWLAERRLNRWVNGLAKWVLRQASAVRVDSRAVLERLAGQGYRNLAYVPFLITNADRLLAPSEQAPAVRAQLLGSRAGPLLLAVSRLEPEKNIPLMLQAVGEAVKVHPGLVLAVAGDGRLAASLASEAEQLAPGAVRWLGRIENADMPLHYQAADLTMLSSNRESAARVLSESLLTGTPVLTTDTAGAREVIEDGVSGRIVPIGDVRGFADALIDICRDPNRLARMGREGRERMTDSVTTDTVLRELCGLYAKALGRAG